jgi:hypothetical protein
MNKKTILTYVKKDYNKIISVFQNIVDLNKLPNDIFILIYIDNNDNLMAMNFNKIRLKYSKKINFLLIINPPLNDFSERIEYLKCTAKSMGLSTDFLILNEEDFLVGKIFGE